MGPAVRNLFLDKRFVLLAYVVGGLFVSIQLYSLGTHLFVMPKAAPADIMNQAPLMKQFEGRRLTEYNNYVIFRCSWYHLLHGLNLYALYPAEHWDFYKYSPTFALFMGLIAWLPDVVGMALWNLLNVLALYAAIRLLPFNNKVLCLLAWYVFNELLTCVSNCQSNGLMAALMIAAFACMEHRKVLWAALWLMVVAYIKVYGLIGCCLFLFYPGRLRAAAWCLLWAIALAALPLVVTPLHMLVWQYHNWATLMVADASAATGLSVNGLLQSWFGLMNAGRAVTVVGLLLFVLPFVRYRLYAHATYRLLILAMMLVWVIIFNHKAESPTYIIAVTGVGIWYFAMPWARWRTALLFFVLVFTSLSTTDFFPAYVRNHFMLPLRIKAFPCVVAWVAVMADVLLLSSPEKNKKLQATIEKRRNFSDISR
jgi:hypothetical protein